LRILNEEYMNTPEGLLAVLIPVGRILVDEEYMKQGFENCGKLVSMVVGITKGIDVRDLGIGYFIVPS
jgi:hypothetical protein